MKNGVAISLLFLAVMACSCETERDAIRQNVPEITFRITPHAGVTRSGRDPNTSEALQWITDMRIYAFRQQADGSTYTYTTVETDGTEGARNYYAVPWTLGTSVKNYTIRPRLAAGDTFIFLGVGLDAGGVNFEEPDFTGKTLPEAALYLKNNAACREVFAGQTASVTIPGDTGINTVLEIRRTVAGVLGYFTNIPATYNGQTVKSIALRLHTGKNTQVSLTAPYTGSVAAGTAGDDLVLNYLLPDPGNSTVTINGETVDVAVSVVNNLYRYAYSGWPAGSDFRIADNSLIQSAFVMPVAAPVTGDHTLQLELRSAAGSVLKFWTIYIDKKQPGDADAALRLYSLLPNHYYALGTKTQPAADGDQPMDLSKDQEFAITVNPDWEAVHDMGITDPINPPQDNNTDVNGDVNLDDDLWDGIN